MRALWHALRDALGSALIEWGARIMTDATKVRLLGKLRRDDLA